MTYKLPLNEDGTVDYVRLAEDIDWGSDGEFEFTPDQILKALVNHTLENAAKVAEQYLYRQGSVKTVEAIRALKTGEPDYER